MLYRITTPRFLEEHMQTNTDIEKLLFSTVRITTESDDGGRGSGTGFLYALEDGDNAMWPFLITNKHVLDGARTATLHFIAGDASGQPLLGQATTVLLQDVPASTFGHQDPDVDIAAIPVATFLNEPKHPSGRLTKFVRIIHSSQVATPPILDDYEPIEPVTFIGYPNGMYDKHSLLPIVRRGISATALNVDYEGKPTFLIDASVFPGSSGSPVFLLDQASTPDKHGNIVIGRGSRCYLLGVVASVYQRQVPIVQATMGNTAYSNELLDIGVVYKASAVDELVRQLVSEHQSGTSQT